MSTRRPDTRLTSVQGQTSSLLVCAVVVVVSKPTLGFEGLENRKNDASEVLGRRRLLNMGFKGREHEVSLNLYIETSRVTVDTIVVVAVCLDTNGTRNPYILTCQTVLEQYERDRPLLYTDI